jgi:4-hydroxy-tetrahydrodipicolinate synthase
MSLINILRGTGVALVTPFSDSGAVDFAALGKLVNHIISEGAQYVVSLGTTGETPTLSKEEKRDIIVATVEVVAGRVPIVIGVAGNDTQATCTDLQTLPLEGATAILSASPYYNKPSQEGIFQHYKAVAAATSKPVLLYNVPGRTGSNITAATTLRLSREVSNIAGIKEASGNMLQCMEILRDRPDDFLVVSGDDALAMAQIACGMDGVISVAANCFPGPFCRMINAALAQDYVTARKLNGGLLKGYDLLFAENNPAGVKAFLSSLGIITNNLRLPLVPLSKGLHDEAGIYLEELFQKEPHA